MGDTKGEYPTALLEQSDPLDVLEAKIRSMEMKLFGAESSFNDSQPVHGTTDLIDSLIKSHTILSSAVTSQEKIGKLVKRMDELDAVLDPSFQVAALHNTAKIETLLLMYDRIRDTSEQLNCLKESASLLNSEQIRGVVEVEDRLNSLTKTVYDNKSKVEAFDQDVRNTLMNYSRMIYSFIKTFSQLNDAITNLEMTSKPVKISD